MSAKAVSGAQAVSIRDLGYVKKNVWLAQAPADPLLAGWLEGTPIV